MDQAELMQKEIESKKKLPDELKKEIKKSIVHNLLIALIIVIYICIANFLFYKVANETFEQCMKVFALILISLTVGIFEVAYKRNSKRTAIIGIELLLCSIISLYIPYIYLFTEVNLKRIITVLPLSIAGYYLIKAFLIYKTGKIKHQNNLSDVREILKETEKNSYIDEESKKTYRENKILEEQYKKEVLEEERRKAKNRQKLIEKSKTKQLAAKEKKTSKSKKTTKTKKKK